MNVLFNNVMVIEPKTEEREKKSELKSSGGIILQEKPRFVENTVTRTVCFVGPDAKGVVKGDTVVISPRTGVVYEITNDSGEVEEYRLLDDKAIIAVK